MVYCVIIRIQSLKVRLKFVLLLLKYISFSWGSFFLLSHSLCLLYLLTCVLPCEPGQCCVVKESDAGAVHVVLPTSVSVDQFDLDSAAIQRVLLDPRVRDRHVVVLSIAGVRRLGKSFILNYLIRYLNSEVPHTVRSL